MENTYRNSSLERWNDGTIDIVAYTRARVVILTRARAPAYTRAKAFHRSTVPLFKLSHGFSVLSRNGSRNADWPTVPPPTQSPGEHSRHLTGRGGVITGTRDAIVQRALDCARCAIFCHRSNPPSSPSVCAGTSVSFVNVVPSVVIKPPSPYSAFSETIVHFDLTPLTRG